MIIICPECATRYAVDQNAFAQGGRAVRCSECGCEWYQIGPPEEAERADPAEAAAAADWRRNAEETAAPAEFLDGDGDGAARARARVHAAFDGGVQDHLDRGFGGAGEAINAEVVDERATAGRRSGLGGRAALFIGAALAIQAPIGLYYLAPQISAAAPASSDALASYRSGVDQAFAWLGSSLGAPAENGVVFVDFRYDLVEDQDGRALLVWGRVANSGERAASPPEIEIVSRDGDGKALQTWRARAEADELQPGESARFASRMMFPLGPVREVDLYFVER